MLQLPLEVAAVEHVDLPVAEPCEEPREKGRVDVVGLPGAIDDYGPVEREANAGEQRRVHRPVQQLRRDPAAARAQRLGIEVDGAGQVAAEVGEYVGPDVHQHHGATGLPRGELLGGDDARAGGGGGRGDRSHRRARGAAANHAGTGDGPRPEPVDHGDSSPMYFFSSST